MTTITADEVSEVLNFGPLAPGASASAQWTCNSSSPYTAVADARHAVDESDETNNALTQTFPNCG